MRSPTDADIVRRLRNGDQDAFPLLLERYQSPLLGFITGMVGDRCTAEDLLQETVLRFLKKLDSYDDRGQLKAYLFTTARNLAIDHLRKRTETLLPDGAPEESQAAIDPHQQLDQLERRDLVLRGIGRLPQPQKEAILLRFYGGFTFARIAETTGVPLGTALARCQYGLRKLKDCLGFLEGEE